MIVPLELPAGLLPALDRPPAPYACLLDGSGPDSWTDGRAVLGWGPRAVLQAERDGSATLRTRAGTRRLSGDPLDLLDEFVATWSPARGPVPEAGGVVVALSYDLRCRIERLPARAAEGDGLPLLHAAAYDWFLALDHRRGRAHLAVAPGAPVDAHALAAQLRRRAARPVSVSRGGAAPRQAAAEMSREAYAAAVATALAFIAAGEIYQVNLAQRFGVHEPPPAPAVFAALQRHPMPFAGYLDAGRFALLSNSPECFLTVAGRAVATCPIKGTRRREADAAADAARRAELATDPKERAEHVMIVDLERNDLGRVCETGSVHVADLCRVVSFPSLHHMVSRICGTLRPGVPLSGLLRATFPGGSITGAPKVRAMEIIDALEPVPRGFYTGALGWIRADGTSVWSLLIRTAIATPGHLTYHAGGGIVADSDIGREHAETLLKAQPFLAAVEGA